MFSIVFLVLAVAAHDRVLLQDVKAITLKQGEFTTARRVPSLPQLHCIGGLGCRGIYDVPSVQCLNAGWDGIDVNWACTTDLPKGTAFGLIEVNCEGYEYPEDPFVLAGSCQLRYNLKRKGLVRDEGGVAKEVSSLASICIAAGLCWVLFRVCHPTTTARDTIPTAQPVSGSGFFTGLALGVAAFVPTGTAHRRRRRGGRGSRTSGSRTSGSSTSSKKSYKATGHARTSRR